MSNRAVGFIGGGRITRVFLDGWRRANALPADIVVSDCNAEALTNIEARFPGVKTTTATRAAAAQEVVFLAVHPPAVAEVATAIKGSIKSTAVVVSLAPKFTIAHLTELLGGFARLARVIPNAPSVVNAGLNPVAFAPALASEDRIEVQRLLAPLGECLQVAEEKLDVYALLTARGPSYFWLQLYELRHFAEAAGLTREEAQHGLEALMAGTLKTMTAAGLERDEVMNLIPVKAPAEIEAAATEVFGKQLPSILEQVRKQAHP